MPFTSDHANRSLVPRLRLPLFICGVVTGCLATVGCEGEPDDLAMVGNGVTGAGGQPGFGSGGQGDAPQPGGSGDDLTTSTGGEPGQTGGTGGEEPGGAADTGAAEATDETEEAGEDQQSGEASDVDSRSDCAGDTPHGCYSLAAGQLPDCPEKPPELPWKYMGCNGVAAAQACTYENGSKMFDCLCDTGVHWLCAYID